MSLERDISHELIEHLRITLKWRNLKKIDIDIKNLSNYMRIRISNSNLFLETGRHSKLTVEKRIRPIRFIFSSNDYHILKVNVAFKVLIFYIKQDQILLSPPILAKVM